MDQQESLSKLLKEAASHEKETKQSPSHDKSILLETLEQLKTEKAAIENSKNELFNKIRELQDMNDKLVVDLEGLKTMKNLSDGLKNDGSGVGDDTIVLLSEGINQNIPIQLQSNHKKQFYFSENEVSVT